jgi:hypothetical protein
MSLLNHGLQSIDSSKQNNLRQPTQHLSNFSQFPILPLQPSSGCHTINRTTEILHAFSPVCSVFKASITARRTLTKPPKPFCSLSLSGSFPFPPLTTKPTRLSTRNFPLHSWIASTNHSRHECYRTFPDASLRKRPKKVIGRQSYQNVRWKLICIMIICSRKNDRTHHSSSAWFFWSTSRLNPQSSNANDSPRFIPWPRSKSLTMNFVRWLS